MVVIADIKS